MRLVVAMDIKGDKQEAIAPATTHFAPLCYNEIRLPGLNPVVSLLAVRFL